MPGINTCHYISRGKWEVNHRRCDATGETLFDIAIVADHVDAIHIVGLNAADVDELSHAISAARQDADQERMADRIDRLLPSPGTQPRECRECGAEAIDGYTRCEKHYQQFNNVNLAAEAAPLSPELTAALAKRNAAFEGIPF